MTLENAETYLDILRKKNEKNKGEKVSHKEDYKIVNI